MQMHMDQMMNQRAMQYPEDMIGAIKIKDGLFIGDSFAAQVSLISFPFEATKKSNFFMFAFK